MSFFASALLLALGTHHHELTVRCPNAGALSMRAPVRRACTALDVSGRIAADGLTLDPAFDVVLSPAEAALPKPGAALLEGFQGNGARLFALPFEPSGAFHLSVPLDAGTLGLLYRLRLSYGGSFVEHVAAGLPEGPQAEVVSSDFAHVLVAWDAHRYPAVRVREVLGGALRATGSGDTSFAQLTVPIGTAEIIVEFSDGVRSVARHFHVFGR